jgi:anthranilate synthase/aminodeoxychorismate synthase-like glutamine amidotransferase
MLLLIDNFDSFTFLLANYFSHLGQEVRVVPNNCISPESQMLKEADYLVISPGPGNTLDAGQSISCIKSCLGRIPILGVCLGQQCLAHIFGAEIVQAKRIMHGKCSWVSCRDSILFSDIPKRIEVTRYHSLVVDPQSLPSCFKVIAYSEDEEIMAIEHKEYPAWGVQFHPESILSKHGEKILGNFLEKSTLNFKV